MSNPNINLSNLDARYSKPADVTAAISTQAATDAGQYALKVIVNAKDYGAKGDSSQDELSNIQSAITAVQAKVTAVGGGVGAVELGSGIYKLSSTLTIPSNIALISSNGFSSHQAVGAQLQPYTGFSNSWLVQTASGSTGSGLVGVTIYLNNSFTCGGLLWQTSNGFMEKVKIDNAYGTALSMVSATANTITHCYISGLRPRSNGSDVISLSSITGTMMVDSGCRDNLYAYNEIDGGAGYLASKYTVRNSSLYHCAVVTYGGGVDRWFGNIIENGDIGLYCGGRRNQIEGNRIEWNSAHGAFFISATGDHQLVGNAYNNNGLGVNDKYYDLVAHCTNSSFVGERFSRDTSGTVAAITTNAVAACIYDDASGDFSNSYSNCRDTRHWVSDFAVIAFAGSANSSDVRAGFPRYSRLYAAPTTGTFNNGERYSVQATPVAGSTIDYIVMGTGTFGSISGTVTATTTLGSNLVTVSDATKIAMGSRINVPGAGFAQTYAQVQDKSGNVLTLDQNATVAVTSVTVTYVGPNTKTTGVITLNGSTTYDPPSLVDGSETTTQTFTLSGASIGDRVDVTFSLDLQGITVRAWVSAANTIAYRFRNTTGSTIDLASGTVKIWVRK